MRFLRFAFGVAVILILMLFAAFLLPSKVTISKSALISAPLSRVESELVDFDRWKNWFPPLQGENVTMLSKPAKTGAVKSVSLTDGQGKKLDLDLLEFKQDTILVMLTSMSATKVNYQFILTNHNNAQTQLTWNVNTELGWYPWDKIRGIFLDKISGPQYEAALAHLKKAAEK